MIRHKKLNQRLNLLHFCTFNEYTYTHLCLITLKITRTNVLFYIRSNQNEYLCAVEGDHPPTQNTLSTGIKGVSHECPWVTGASVQLTGLTHTSL